MRVRALPGVLLVVGWLMSASPVRAQQEITRDGSNEFGFWVALAPDSYSLIGHMRNHKLYSAGFRYGRVFSVSRFVSVTYTFDIVPLAVFAEPDHCRPVYAGGVYPGGLRVNLWRQRRVQPFIGTSGGFLAATRTVPLDHPNGSRVNFAFDFSAGVQVFNAGGTRALMFGWKTQHVSNAMRTTFNPGADYSTFFFGMSFFRRSRRPRSLGE